MKRSIIFGSLVFACFAFFAGLIHAGDCTVTLDDNAGSSSFVVQDSDKTNQFKVNSDGQGYFGGKVGIGTTEPTNLFHVSSPDGKNLATQIVRITNNDSTLGESHGLIINAGNGTDDYAFFVRNRAETVNGLVVKGDGSVGIGITSPLALLDLEGDETPLLRLKGNSNSVIPVLRLMSPSDGYAEISYTPSPTVSSRKLNFAVNNDTIRMVIDGNGNVGIGTASPTEKLEVSGNIKASGTVSQGSSREYKKHISKISAKEAMKTLNGLDPVRFQYKTDNSGEKHLGFIAEDVPDLVAEKDRKHLNSMDISAVLTKVVQEQQKMLQKQQKTISALKAELEEIKGRL